MHVKIDTPQAVVDLTSGYKITNSTQCNIDMYRYAILIPKGTTGVDMKFIIDDECIQEKIVSSLFSVSETETGDTLNYSDKRHVFVAGITPFLAT